MSADSRLSILEGQVRNSKAHTQDEIAAMADSIELAALINGDDDIIRRSLKQILINGVRRELKDPDRIQNIAESVAKVAATAAVKKHIEDCGKLNNNAISMEKGRLRVTGKAAVVLSLFLGLFLAVGMVLWWQTSKTEEIMKAYKELVAHK